MTFKRPKSWLAGIVAVSALVVLASGFLGWQAHAESQLLQVAIDDLESETDALLAGEQDQPTVVDAALATWSDLVTGLHQAAAAARLAGFGYTMGEVIALADPRAPLADGYLLGRQPTDDDDYDDDYDYEDADTGEEEPVDPSSLPYRVLIANVQGTGDYQSIVTLAGLLAANDPPMGLDELVILADGPRPRFEGRVYLVTALPVEPRP